ERMPLEPDLAEAKAVLRTAVNVVVVTPLWWGSVPALLKGFFDRALLPQQEYRFTAAGLPVGLVPAGRGRLLLLADTPWYFTPLTGLPAQTQVVRNTMRLCGISSVHTHRMLGVKSSSPARIERWLDRATHLGIVDGSRDRREARAQAALAPSAVG